MRRSRDELLRRVMGPLKLERERGFRDTAVTGGMSALITRLAGDLLQADPGLPADELRELVAAFEDYPRLAPRQRRSLVEAAEAIFGAPAAGRRPPKVPQVAVTDTSLPSLSRDAPVTDLKGVGPARVELLAGLGISTVGDLLRHYPARYEDRSRVSRLGELRHGQTAVVRVEVTGRGRARRRGKRGTAWLPVTDGETRGELVWFNQPYRVRDMKPGDALLVVGTARVQSGRISLAVSECEPADAEGPHTGGLVPVYPATEGVSQRLLRRLMAQALERCEPPPDPLPDELRLARGLMPLPEALRRVHFPPDEAAGREARRCVTYHDLLAMQLALAMRRREVRAPTPDGRVPVEGAAEELAQHLPFEPTGAQQRVIAEVMADLAADEPAHRLVHGDVGSGKTVVAAAALLAAARAGRQGAVMAPTELLAEQHHATLSTLLRPLGVEPVLLTGGLSPDERRAVRDEISSGRARCVVGTHALFAEGVRFDDLAVVIVDEQHRFGVQQRARLAAKGERPNVLVMSATPIPRTLALTVWGDFDVSTIDELPPGRRRPQTEVLPRERRDEAWDLLRERLAEGRQAYVVCPHVEPSEELEVSAAVTTFDELRGGPLADARLGLLHGRMDGEQRRAVMEDFRRGAVQVLVATNLIEVGVDVPNASVMVIDSAERFGLAQLHQLRGRISRSSHQPHCLLLAGDCGPEALERLAVLARTHDGFEIAEEDLRRRGPGELIGLRQHGFGALVAAGMPADTRTLAQAREDAFALVERDPELCAPEHEGLAELAARMGGTEPWAF
ncbi:MAG: ATP-dependent DNA helicase RecG [Armatimonadetes bacterium]|nr:ATP-dependent DNA helicase RecG [Armatimonadota bacterium]